MASGDKYTIQEDTLTNIGDAIREKTSSQAGITPENMPDAIRSIQTGSDVTITPTYQTGTKIADFEVDGVAGALYAPIVDISQADFDLLPTAVKNNGTLYFITDGDVPNLDEMSF